MPKPELFDFMSQLEEPTNASGMTDALLREVKDQQAKIETKMLNGGCKTMESYADAVGFYRAIKFMLGYADRKAQDDANKLGAIIEDEANYQDLP